MKIIRNGDLRYERKPLQFECKNCKTVFEAEKTEYEYFGDQRKAITTSVNAHCATNGILQLKDNRLTDRVSRYPKTVIGRGQGACFAEVLLFGFKAVNQCGKWI